MISDNHLNELSQPNILINNEKPPRACIADFGLCAIAPTASFGPTKAGDGGTFGYMAPELLEGAKASKEADMYAFGMVVYEVITGTLPFGHRRAVELPMLTIRGSRPPRPEDPVATGFGQGTWELVERCWEKNPEQRPTAREALEHFEGVARTSTAVGPGPTIPVNEPVYPRSENSSRDLCEYHEFTQCLRSDSTSAKILLPSSANNPRRFRQTSYATRVLVSNRAVPVPTLPAGREPNLLDRVFRLFISPRPAPRLEESPQDDS